MVKIIASLGAHASLGMYQIVILFSLHSSKFTQDSRSLDKMTVSAAADLLQYLNPCHTRCHTYQDIVGL